MNVQTPFEPDAFTTPESAPIVPQAPQRGSRWVWVVVAVGVLWVLAGAVGAAAFVLGSDRGSPATPHVARTGEPALTSVPGYTYADLAGDVSWGAYTDLSTSFKAMNRRASKAFPKLGDLYTGWSMHEVRADDDYVGTMLVAAINPEYELQGVLSNDDILAGETMNMEAQGLEVQTETIAGQKVLVGLSDETWFAAWISDSTEMCAYIDSESQLRDFVTAAIEAANG